MKDLMRVHFSETSMSVTVTPSELKLANTTIPTPCLWTPTKLPYGIRCLMYYPTCSGVGTVRGGGNNQAVYYVYYIKRLIVKETAQERNERRQAFFGKYN